MLVRFVILCSSDKIHFLSTSESKSSIKTSQSERKCTLPWREHLFSSCRYFGFSLHPSVTSSFITPFTSFSFLQQTFDRTGVILRAAFLFELLETNWRHKTVWKSQQLTARTRRTHRFKQKPQRELQTLNVGWNGNENRKRMFANFINTGFSKEVHNKCIKCWNRTTCLHQSQLNWL